MPNLDIYNAEKKRTEQFILKNPKLRIVKSYIEEVNYPFLIVLVFGSYVMGTNTTGSDIDICVIVDNNEKLKILLEKLRLFALPLEIHDFTTAQFNSMIEKKQNNLGNEIVNKNIILYGVENYYNLVSKWMKK